jgi:hypothetical protein
MLFCLDFFLTLAHEKTLAHLNRYQCRYDVGKQELMNGVTRISQARTRPNICFFTRMSNAIFLPLRSIKNVADPFESNNSSPVPAIEAYSPDNVAESRSSQSSN